MDNIDEVIRDLLDELKRDGFAPVAVKFDGLQPGQRPATTIVYERSVNGATETRRVVFG